MKSINKSIKESAPLLFGEAVAVALVVVGYAVASAFTEISMTGAVLGALLGALVSVLNYFFLSLAVNRAVDGYLELRGTHEMTDEQAEKFTAEHSMRIQNALRTSFLARTVSIVAVLVLAFITEWFSPLATAIPLLLYRPILTVSEIIREKLQRAKSTKSAEKFSCGQDAGRCDAPKEAAGASLSDTENDNGCIPAQTKEGDE
ncbi:MAG: ATP synthase subunit I [Clostridia bacterium]|nr:ATP synthase subunit I [Clostridia bacterium]